MNHPFLINPEKLTPSEEAYFLSHVFKVDELEARNDSIDGPGGRIRGTPTWRDENFLSGLKDLRQAAEVLGPNFTSLPPGASCF